MKFAKQYWERFAELTEKEDDYEGFNGQFGECLTLEVHEESTTAQGRGLMRYQTSKPGDEQSGLEEYVDRTGARAEGGSSSGRRGGGDAGGDVND